MSQTNPKPDFAAQLHELEQITSWFESDQVNLDEGLAKFERGMELAAGLKNYLQTVENKVEVIKRKFDAPAPADEPEVSPPADPELF